MSPLTKDKVMPAIGNEQRGGGNILYIDIVGGKSYKLRGYLGQGLGKGPLIAPL